MPRPVDFIDGVFFSPTEAYLTLAGSTGRTPYTSDYTWTEIYTTRSRANVRTG